LILEVIISAVNRYRGRAYIEIFKRSHLFNLESEVWLDDITRANNKRGNVSEISEGSGKTSITIDEAADPEAESSTAPGTDVPLTSHSGIWGIGFFRFRFRLANLRPGRGFSERRFSIAEGAVLFLAAYLASHGLGLVRQVIFNAIFGAGSAANAYYAAFRLPDTLFSLIAGGALIQAFVPVFISYEKEHGRLEMWRLTSLVFNLLLVTLTALVLFAEFTAPAFVSHWLVPGYSPSEQALTTTLTRIMLVQPLLLGLGSIITSILNSKRQFLLPALSIAVYNVGLIGGLLVALVVPGVGIYGPTVGVVISAVIQVFVQVPGLVKQRVTYTFTWNLKDPGLREILSLLGPNIISVVVVTAGLIVDTAFTSYMKDKASLSAIHNAHLLFDLPIAFLGQTLGLIALPQMSRLAVDGRYLRLRSLVMKIVGGTVLISVFVAFLLYLLGRPLIRLFLQHGAFTAHASSLTALVLIGYAVGLPGRVAGDLLTRSFYSIKNAVIPLLTNLLAFALRMGLLLMLLRLLKGKYVLLAIPLSVGAAQTLEAGVLFLLLCFYFLRKLQRERGTPVGDRANAIDGDEKEVDEF
jgi:putative peptidoglycan lipid II flippase